MTPKIQIMTREEKEALRRLRELMQQFKKNTVRINSQTHSQTRSETELRNPNH